MREVKKPFFVVNLSGGKDSTAMLLKLLEVGYPIDDVVTFITGFEFDEQLEHLSLLEQREGIKINRLKISDNPKQDFIYEMLYKPILKNNNVTVYGNGFPTFLNRWCTGFFKIRPARQYKKEKALQGFKIYNYIGIAYDEKKRANSDALYPLIDWHWKEKDCLNYCYSKGYDFGGLYNKFRRFSCWCCPLQCMSDFQTLFEEYPEKWQELKSWQKIKPSVGFYPRPNKTIEELEECFKRKDYRAVKRKF